VAADASLSRGPAAVLIDRNTVVPRLGLCNELNRTEAAAEPSRPDNDAAAGPARRNSDTYPPPFGDLRIDVRGDDEDEGGGSPAVLTDDCAAFSACAWTMADGGQENHSARKRNRK